MLQKIIAGIDPMPGSCDAAALASALSRATGADVLLVTAYQDPLLPFPPVFGGTARVHDAHALLARVRPTWCPEGHTRAVPDYSPARALRRTARDEHADVLVLGSHEQAKTGHAHAGRTGRQVMHDAPCAVAFAAAGLHDGGGPVTLRRILVGVDDTTESEAALALGRELAQRAGATLVAVGVVDDRLPIEAAPFGEIVDLARWDDIVAARRLHVEARLNDLVDGTPDVAVEVRVGDPACELASASEGADLLVVGSRRWGAIERVALGTTSEQLVQTAPCSVLVVPRPVAADHEHGPSPAVAASDRTG